jgi:hypothetical protein
MRARTLALVVAFASGPASLAMAQQDEAALTPEGNDSQTLDDRQSMATGPDDGAFWDNYWYQPPAGSYQQPMAGSYQLQQPMAGSYQSQQPLYGTYQLQQPMVGTYQLQQPLYGTYQLQQPLQGAYPLQQPLMGSTQTRPPPVQVAPRTR